MFFQVMIGAQRSSFYFATPLPGVNTVRSVIKKCNRQHLFLGTVFRDSMFALLYT